MKSWLVRPILTLAILLGELVRGRLRVHFSFVSPLPSARVNTSRKQGGLGKMNIPLIADKNMDISSELTRILSSSITTCFSPAKYGVLKEDEGIAFRGLFIIDPRGILRQITINDLPVGRSVDETLRLVQAFQFTDKHGEGKQSDSLTLTLTHRCLVCPANWKPGKKTINPDVTKSKEYFEHAN